MNRRNVMLIRGPTSALAFADDLKMRCSCVRCVWPAIITIILFVSGNSVTSRVMLSRKSNLLVAPKERDSISVLPAASVQISDSLSGCQET
jgi:hypothetical protein